jgi:arylsulfatase A-like enzyme
MPTPQRRQRPDRRPSFVFFFTDQQRHDSVGLHGNPLGLTPNFDRLARSHTHAAHTFSPNPVCGPCRACLQTGTYASTNGVFRNGIPLPRHDELPNMGTLFKQAGYKTGYVGKWHLGTKQAVPPEERAGYDDFWLASNATESDSDAYETLLHDGDGNPVHLPGYRVDATVDAAIRFIDENKDEPFFLFISLLEPHFQNHVDDYPPPHGYREMYESRWTPPDLMALPKDDRAAPMEESETGGNAARSLGGYWGMCKRIDEAYGRLHDALYSLGLNKDTVTVFTSDHGCHFKTRNGEYKRSVHDVSMRVPCCLTGGPFEGGGELPGFVNLIDLPPTLLACADIAPPESMQGRSILPLLHRQVRPGDGWPEEAFTQVSESHYGRAVRSRRWKYGVLAEDNAAAGKTGMTDRYVESHLYDLESDPYELVNLIRLESHAKVRQVMRDRLLRRMKDAGEPTPTIVEIDSHRSGQRRVAEHEAYL